MTKQQLSKRNHVGEIHSHVTLLIALQQRLFIVTCIFHKLSVNASIFTALHSILRYYSIPCLPFYSLLCPIHFLLLYTTGAQPAAGQLYAALCGRARITSVDPSPKKRLYFYMKRKKFNSIKNFNSDQKLYIQNFDLQKENTVATLVFV